MRRIILFVAVATLFLIASLRAEDKLLKPVRSSVQLDTYQIDIAEAKTKKVSQDRVALSIRIADQNKKLIKPAKVFLTAGSKMLKPLSRKDHWSSEDSEGLPVSSAVSSSGGVSLGVNLTSLAASKGNYSYTVFEFNSKDFYSGASLKITLPDKKELAILLSSIAE